MARTEKVTVTVEGPAGDGLSIGNGNELGGTGLGDRPPFGGS